MNSFCKVFFDYRGNEQPFESKKIVNFATHLSKWRLSFVLPSDKRIAGTCTGDKIHVILCNFKTT